MCWSPQNRQLRTHINFLCHGQSEATPWLAAKTASPAGGVCWLCFFLIFAGSRLNTSSLDRRNLEFKLPPRARHHRAGLCGVQRDIPRSLPHPHSHPLLWTKFFPRHCWTRLWYGGWNDWLSLISGSFHVNHSSGKSVESCTIPTWLLITCSSSLLQQKWEKEHFSGNS